MTHSTPIYRKELQQNKEKEDQEFEISAAPTCEASHQEQEEERKEPMVTPKRTCYLSNDGKYSPDETKLPHRVQSTQSLLGLAGLEGHEESDEEISLTGESAVEEQEVMDIELSPTTPASMSEGHDIEVATCNTTPPGSVQGPGILSLSPPLLTTYSAGSVTSASVTDSFVVQPRPIQSMQRPNQLPHDSPRFSRSPLVQQPQLQLQPQPRSRPPRAPHHPSTIPGSNNSVGGGHMLVPRAVIGTGPDSSSLSGAGASGGRHSRTPSDATNYSFLSLLTESSGGEYTAPRRRTMSWDNNGDSKRAGPALESQSLEAPSTPGSILQPILLPEDLESTARPPMSISTSNLRRALPIASGLTATTPTYPPSSSRNTSNTTLFAPSSLQSRENLHPLIQELQNISHAKSPTFMSPSSRSRDETNLHPLVKKIRNASPGHTASTSSTSPFTVHLHDEKKDDESSRSHKMMQQKLLHDRKSSDYGSYSSSFCSHTTIRLQKKPIASPGNMHGAFERQTSPQRISENGVTDDSKHTGCARFDLADIMDATKECSVETNIIEGIERYNPIVIGKQNCKEDFLSFSDWPYFLLAWGFLNLGSRGFVLNTDANIEIIFVSDNFVRFCLVLGAAAVVKRNLSKKFLDRQVMGQYWDELSRLRNVWLVLNEIAVLSTKEEDNSDGVEGHALRFRSVGQRIDNIMDWNVSSLFGKLGTTRENFIESAQIVYERLVRRDGEVELSFETICEATKLPDDSIDRSKVKMLSEIFCPSRQGHVSRFDFVKSIDSIFKTTTLLVANISNVSEICHAVDHVVNVIFCTMAAILAPSAIGADANTLVLTLLGVSAICTFIIYTISAEDLKGIFRIIVQKSYDIGDRVYFVPENTETKADDGPPSGGWIVESIDLYKTTLRQGITGHRSTFSNGSTLLTNTRVINWKRSHRAVVRLSMEFSSKTRRDKIDFFRRQISEWIEDRPCEWIHLDSFRMVDTDIHQECIKYDVVLRHRESWYNYASVQDSKSDILVFLHQLRNNVGA